jgi:hypothetical protein
VNLGKRSVDGGVLADRLGNRLVTKRLVAVMRFKSSGAGNGPDVNSVNSAIRKGRANLGLAMTAD